MLFEMRSPKKTVSLFQSHVFKHEFFLLESCPFPVPSELRIIKEEIAEGREQGQNWE